jgi:hypothetical protein
MGRRVHAAARMLSGMQQSGISKLPTCSFLPPTAETARNFNYTYLGQELGSHAARTPSRQW